MVLLTEFQFIGDKSDAQALLVDGFLTDGTPQPAPAPRKRRIEFLGDSLTAGYGSGFDQPPGTTCGGGTLIDDVSWFPLVHSER